MSRNLETRLQRLERAKVPDAEQIAAANDARQKLLGLLDRIGATAFLGRLERNAAPAAIRLCRLVEASHAGA